MTDTEEKTNDRGKSVGEALKNLVLIAHRMSHPGIVIVAAAALDRSLERAIKLQLPNTSANLRKRLFDGDRSPLSSFSAKIDMAHAMGITSDFIHQELEKIRKMRNMFSHSEQPLSLDVEPMKTMFYNLRRPPDASGSYGDQFEACVRVIDDYIEQFLYRIGDRGEHLALRWLKTSPEGDPQPRPE